MNSTLKYSNIFISIFLLISADAFCQDISITNIPEGKYLVIGSFNFKENAVGFTEYVKKMNEYDVKLAYQPTTKLYRVYIKGYDENQDGFADVKKMRRQTEFIDTWYMVVEPYELSHGNQALIPQTEQVMTKEETENNIDESNSIKADGRVHAVSPSVIEKNYPITDLMAEPEMELVKASNVQNSGSSQPASNLIPNTYIEKGKYKLYFNAYYKKNFKEIKGPVEIINPITLRLLRVAESLELVRIPDPNNGEHSVQFIANIFGYKKVQHDIRLDEPFDEVNEEFFHFKGDTLIADFPLSRYDQGDIATMYNVFFFKDAAIMKPNSKFELSSLVDMLKENDELKIKIHGHTNGTARGKIITLPDESQQFFTLNQDVEEKFGSAKDLSKQRAEVIKNYLRSYGLAPGRMEVLGWGGKKPIYDKMDRLAVKNVRVEIEILEN